MMYLLLRDNKQSGPYSLDDLKTKGLKAYDLVWVEGKSAAWRYPSEIDELSAFSPAVEEQPFDRFFKRPAAQASAGAVTSSAVPPFAMASSAAATVTAQPHYAEEQAPATRKRTIYVTMPGAAAAAAAPVTVRETIRTAPAIRPAAAALPIDDYTFGEPAANRLDNQPDHTTERNYHSGELLPRPRPRNKSALLQPVLIGVGVLVLLAGGIFIGLSINKDNPTLQKLAARTAQTENTTTNNSQPVTRNTATPLPVPPAVSPAVTASQQQSTNPAATTQNRDHAGVATTSTSGSTPTTQTVAARTGKTTASKQKAIKPAGQTALSPATVTDSSTTGLAVVHREAVHRTDPADNSDAGKGSLKINLASQVAVGANKYEVGTFGGISNLQVTVSNKSAYPLDLVVVEVQYIQANKKTYKTEDLYFHSVGPGMALMQEAPKSSRGIRIEYKITQISSKELESTSGL